MSNHLLIAGTGRAGTSLLVRLLAELGLGTQISKSGETGWVDDANAGLEDFVHHAGVDLPYVAKSPWLYEFVDEVLDREDIAIDGVIIPVRNLAEAASSRTILELQNIHRSHQWMTAEKKTWENWALTPGGVLYSLNPLDEARLLAVGFHHLVERLANAGIPMYLLAFPRFTQDAEYFYTTLKGCLPPGVTFETVKAAHAKLVDPDKVRVTAEIAQPVGRGTLKAPENYPPLEDLDNIALRRELVKVRSELVKVGSEHRSTVAAYTTAVDDAAALRNQVQALEQELQAKIQEVEVRRAEALALQRSTSWRTTAPLRALAELVRKR